MRRLPTLDTSSARSMIQRAEHALRTKQLNLAHLYMKRGTELLHKPTIGTAYIEIKPDISGWRAALADVLPPTPAARLTTTTEGNNQ